MRKVFIKNGCFYCKIVAVTPTAIQLLPLSSVSEVICQSCQGCQRASLALPILPFWLPVEMLCLSSPLTVGDIVEVSLAARNLLSNTVLLYTMPLLVMIFSAVLVQWQGASEGLTAFTGISSLIGYFIALHYWLRLPSRLFVSKI